MKTIKILVFFLTSLLSATAYCTAPDISVGKTYRFLVIREGNFPQDRFLLTVSPQEYKYFIDCGKKTVGNAGGQPFRVTSYTINYSGKYALWSVTGALDEIPHIKTMLDKGYIVMLDAGEIVTDLDGRTFFAPEHYADLPSDFYEVAESSASVSST